VRVISPRSHSSFVDVVRGQAADRPDLAAFTFLENGETESDALTYAQLDRNARAVAARLQASTSAGDRALLLYPPGLDFIAAFLGCLYAGVVAVPAYPPRRNRSIERLNAIGADAQATVALTNATGAKSLARGDGGVLGVPVLVADRDAGLDPEAWVAPSLEPGTLAFLQYTSGSTGTPKGVMVTHGNLLHNNALLKVGFSHSTATVFVSWLPVFHDMGLVGNVLSPIYCGCRTVLMGPAAFLQKPVRWLRAISRYRATMSGAPNSAYELCVRKVTPEDRASLDLSSWEFAFNGAEPVRASTIQRFYETFAPCGLRLESIQPCYGMAEATLLVSIGGRGQTPIVHTDEQGLTFVSSGRPWLEERIVIVDPETRERLPDGQTGEIWIASQSVAAGYWNQPEETASTFAGRIAPDNDGPFLRSGDLGFTQGDQLFVAGRLKDLIIVRGRNLYPQDIEYTAGTAHAALSADATAAFSIPADDAEESEQLVVVCEVVRERLARLNADEVLLAARQMVAEEHEVDPAAIVLLRPLSLPKTSSGKIQRGACCERFLAGTLDVVAEWRRPTQGSRSLDTSLRGASAVASYAAVRDWLVARIAEQTGVTPEHVGIGDPFSRYGLDSQRAVALSGELQDWLGQPIPATVAYDFPSIDALARHLSGGAPSHGRMPAGGRATPTGGEPIAIIGIGCRFPEAATPEQFWELLVGAADTIGPAPPARPHAAALGVGGFLDSVEAFDADFFGITPREAEMMDPQQRLLLEVAWEAIENAGIDATRLAGSRTGVFVGISNLDYMRLQVGRAAATDPYAGTGNGLSIAANRLSYLLDLHGPSWAVDTACSSSLVAVHQACESLRRDECSTALCGGANLILAPQLTAVFTRAGMLSPSLRCKTFDADADGYVRGEGAALVVLKRLPDALNDGDKIVAVIRGSAVNQDGRSNGLTAPNGPAQQWVVRAALDAAGVSPSAIGYVEAHGTGTPLGDPIEMNALVEVLGEGRQTGERCAVGSAKTNVGHLESAAGIAGLIKTALALQHGVVPPNLHFARPNPHITLDGTPFFVPTSVEEWPARHGPRRAGVSAFGFGGTNAHVVLEEPTPATASLANDVPERPAHVLTLSAKSEAALVALVSRTAAHLRGHPDIPFADHAFVANTGRARFPFRLALVSPSSADAAERLDSFAAGDEAPRLVSGRAPASDPRVAFLFTGQGSQYAGMARDLFETEPVFRRTMLDLDDVFRSVSPISLLSVIYPDDSKSASIDDTLYTQPALFALECALARLWASWGVEPAAVMGHSVGEYAAACVAGMFDADQGLRLVAARARLMQSLPRRGSMRVVFADTAQVAAAVEPYRDRVSVAAANGPRNTIMSGETAAIEAVAATLERDGLASTPLNTSHAFHSPLMEPIVEEFRKAAEQITFRQPRIPIVSNLTGQIGDESMATPGYWCRHILAPVQYATGVDALHADGCRVLVELGPRPDLIGMGKRVIVDPDAATWIPSLQQKRPGWESMLDAVAALSIQGVAVAWDGFDGGRGRRRVSLPLYPFQRQRFWIDEEADTRVAADEPTHPLLGRRLPEAAHAPGTSVWESSLSLDRLPYLADHSVLGSAVLPYAAFVEMALAAVGQMSEEPRHRVTDLRLHHPVVLSQLEPTKLQVAVDRSGSEGWRLRVYNRVGSAWTLSASASVHGWSI
jgi:acyl transferase domain-containing protein/acyl-CoA synthetase (AMP-forming)/AMP-acid ligase II/acyl carrier protein